MRSAAGASRPWDGFLRRRPPSAVQPDGERFRGRRILVTGAGGYIGSALVRALACFAPERLVLLDVVEYGLYGLERDLRQERATVQQSFVVGDVSDEALLREIMTAHRPDLVVHAAALKHVPLMEHNPLAAAATNALGTELVARCARECGVGELVMLSTDKAADPVSVMGATKRVAELVVLAEEGAMRAKAIRLANVLGSSGSVAPLFVAQAARGEEVTVTDAAATRYFLSLEETVRAVLLAAAWPGRGLLIPKVGAAYRIEDLARFLLSSEVGKATAARLVYTGLRPGDKLHERMIAAGETVRERSGDWPLLEVESPRLSAGQMATLLEAMRAAVRLRDLPALRRALMDMVPEYMPPVEPDVAEAGMTREAVR